MNDSSYYLTGILDTDRVIISKLNDKSLISACNTSDYARNKLCDSQFWHARFIEVFGIDVDVDDIREAYRILALGTPTEKFTYIIEHGDVLLFDRFSGELKIMYAYTERKIVNVAIKHRQYEILRRLVDIFHNGEDVWNEAREYKDPIASEIALMKTHLRDLDRIWYWKYDVVNYGTPRLVRLFFQRIEDSGDNPIFYLSEFIVNAIREDKYDLAKSSVEFALDYQQKKNDVNSLTSITEKVLHEFLPEAVRHGEVDFVFVVIDALTTRTSWNLLNTLMATIEINNLQMFEALSKPYLHGTEDEHHIPLEVAVDSGNIEAVKIAIENTSKNSLSNRESNNLLARAIYKNRIGVAEYFITHQLGNLSEIYMTSKPRNAIVKAITNNQVDMVRFLLDHGIYDLTKDKELLRIAANANNVLISTLLLDHGAPPVLYKKIDPLIRRLIASYK